MNKVIKNKKIFSGELKFQTMIATGWILLMILVLLQTLICNVQKQLVLRINKLDSFKKNLKMKEETKKDY